MRKRIELKNLRFTEGVDHLSVTADIYSHGIKIGEVLDDGWADEVYIELENENIVDNNDLKKIKDMFIKSRGYKDVRVNSGCYQLSLIK
jgi:hypothetical protein